MLFFIILSQRQILNLIIIFRLDISVIMGNDTEALPGGGNLKSLDRSRTFVALLCLVRKNKLHN